MKVAMFEGYGVDAPAPDSRVEDVIRGQIEVMQGVQASLWSAHSSWRNGKWLSGIVFPTSLILRIGSYDWGEAVNAWQASVDTWWKSEMTDTVRNDPFAKGQDGATRLEAWTKMGQGLVTWSQKIASDMSDDTLANDLRFFAENFKKVISAAISAGLKLPFQILPTWLLVAAAAFGGLYLYNTFRRRG